MGQSTANEDAQVQSAPHSQQRATLQSAQPASLQQPLWQPLLTQRTCHGRPGARRACLGEPGRGGKWGTSPRAALLPTPAPAAAVPPPAALRRRRPPWPLRRSAVPPAHLPARSSVAAAACHRLLDLLQCEEHDHVPGAQPAKVGDEALVEGACIWGRGQAGRVRHEARRSWPVAGRQGRGQGSVARAGKPPSAAALRPVACCQRTQPRTPQHAAPSAQRPAPSAQRAAPARSPSAHPGRRSWRS
jgi:hypothetical protein